MNIDSDVVRRLRLERNWSQEQLSEASGLSLRTIQRLEGTGRASIESVRALAAALDVDASELTAPDGPVEMTPLEAVKRGFSKFADFSDTATRYEYWWFLVFVLLLAAIATVLSHDAYQIVGLIVLVPLIAAGTRRLNDVGRSGWWQLLFLVPFGAVVVFVMMAEEGMGSSR